MAERGASGRSLAGSDLAAVPAHPPLGVWLAASAIAALLLLILIHLPDWLPRSQTLIANPHSLHLDRLGAAAPGTTRVVAIGSSKLQMAIEHDDVFAAAMTVQPMLRLHRITWDSAQYTDLRPAFEALEQHPPQLLVLESDLLVFDYTQARDATAPSISLSTRLRRTVRLLSQRFRNGASGAELNRGVDRALSEAECAARKAPQSVQRYAEEVLTWRLSGPQFRAPYLAHLRALQRSGTRIVLLEIPRSPAAQSVVPATFEAGAIALAQSLATTENFDLWRAPRGTESDYCDQGHASDTGQHHFSAWLRDRLSDWMSSPHG